MRLLSFHEEQRRFELSKDWEDDEVPQYAILSHTWGADEDEVTFKDVVEGTGGHKSGYRKLVFCAEQARRDDITFFWVDTCCIDKTDNVVLNTAITSMFRWYQRAEKCYVYLSDVLATTNYVTGSSLPLWRSDFRQSRWLSRGWTLQELLAPDVVEFYDSTGTKLGDKVSLEREICDVSGIPVEALRGRSFSTFSIEERFSWQRSRRTKKAEDKAYALSGICGVSMIPVYGEGYGAAMSRLRKLIDDASTGTERQHFTIPFSVAGVAEAPRFVGREQELQEIHSSLAGDGRRRTVVLHGLGGMGKTQTAIAYASRHRKSYSAIFWFNIQDESLLKQSFVKAAQRVLQYHPSAGWVCNTDLNGDLNEVVSAVKAWLSEADNTRWLAIYDNYDNPKIRGTQDMAAVDISKFLPDAHQGSIIVTTRSSQVRIGQCIPMRKLADVNESVAILSSMSRRELSTEDRNVLALIERLDGLPLALATAGAYLDQVSISMADYLRLYDTSWREIHESDISLDSYENRTLYSTWRLSFDEIKQQNDLAAKLLMLWCYFSNRDLWYELLSVGPSEQVPWIRELTSSLHVFSQAMRVLCNYGLAESEGLLPGGGDSRGYSIHNCVHLWVTHALNTPLDPALARYAIESIARHVPREDDANPWLTQRRLLQHTDRCIELVKGGSVVDIDLEGPLNRFGVLYESQGKLAEAEEMYLRALRGYENTLRADHASTLGVLDHLGLLYNAQGRLAEAEEMFSRALTRKHMALGDDQTSMLKIFNSLGRVYEEQGKFIEAEEMFERALAREEEALGTDHVSTLNTVHNMATIYAKQGKPADAEEMYQRALTGYENAFGLNMSNLLALNTIDNLGNLYKNQGNLAKAEETYKRPITDYDLILRYDHRLANRQAQLLCNLYRQMAYQHRTQHHPSVTYYSRSMMKDGGSSYSRILMETISICQQYPSSSSVVYGDLGRILMWGGKDNEAALAFEHQIARARDVICDGCYTSISAQIERLVCRSLPGRRSLPRVLRQVRSRRSQDPWLSRPLILRIHSQGAGIELEWYDADEWRHIGGVVRWVGNIVAHPNPNVESEQGGGASLDAPTSDIGSDLSDI